jgi:hypothetical protein
MAHNRALAAPYLAVKGIRSPVNARLVKTL